MTHKTKRRLCDFKYEVQIVIKQYKMNTPALRNLGNILRKVEGKICLKNVITELNTLYTNLKFE